MAMFLLDACSARRTLAYAYTTRMPFTLSFPGLPYRKERHYRRLRDKVCCCQSGYVTAGIKREAQLDPPRVLYALTRKNVKHPKEPSKPIELLLNLLFKSYFMTFGRFPAVLAATGRFPHPS